MSLITTMPLMLLVETDTIPVRPVQAKKQNASGGHNTYWAVLTPKADGTRVDTGFGVKVPAFGDTLPSSVTLIDQDGTEIVLALAPKAATYQDRDTKKMVPRKHPAVGVQQTVTLSGEAKQVKVSISDTGDGQNNLKVTISGVAGGGASGSPVRQISDL